MHQCFSRILVFLLLICNTGCLTHERKVTKQESIEFANNLVASIAERNPNVFNKIFDVETLKRRIKEASNGKLPDTLLADIPSALKKRRLGDQLVASVGKEGMYQVVKSYEKNGKQHVIFRLYGEDGLNYHDTELMHAGEEIKVADMYIYLTGENFSKSLADIYLQLGNYSNTGQGDMDFVKSVTAIKKFTAQEEYAEALSVFEKLPDNLRKQKLFQLMHVQITSKLENDVYKKALDEYGKLFPDEPGMYILFLEIHFSHGEYERALEDINKMDSLINKDPFLDYYRGLIYKEMKNSARAKGYFESLYKNMPAFGDGILELIGIYAKSGETDKANALVKVYKKNKKLNQENLNVMYLLYPKLEK